jgi:hypothetical protein
VDVLQVLHNTSTGTANYRRTGVRVQNVPEYYILIEWHDAAVPPTYDQTKN